MKFFFRNLVVSGFQNSVAEELGVHQTTVCKTQSAVKQNILDKAHIWIKFPKTAEEIVEAKQLWTQNYIFLSAIGVIDCTHVRIPKFADFGDEYINRSYFFLIVKIVKNI